VWYEAVVTISPDNVCTEEKIRNGDACDLGDSVLCIYDTIDQTGDDGQALDQGVQ
jgi:hypothetical protein